MSCPATLDEFIKTSAKPIDKALATKLFKGLQTLRAKGSRPSAKGLSGGGNMSLKKLSLLFMVVLFGISGLCYFTQNLVDEMNFFLDMFNPRHFQHMYDIMGKTQATLGFLQRFTEYFRDIIIKGHDDPSVVIPAWVQNILTTFSHIQNDGLNDATKNKLIDLKNSIVLSETDTLVSDDDKFYDAIDFENIEYKKPLILSLDDYKITITKGTKTGGTKGLSKSGTRNGKKSKRKRVKN